MESEERKKIRQFSLTNADLRRLYMEHLDYERKLASLEGNYYLTPQEEMTLKVLKKRKLAGKEAMMKMIDQISSDQFSASA